MAEQTRLDKEEEGAEARDAATSRAEANMTTRDAATSTTAQAPEKLWTPVFVIIVIATLCGFLIGQGSNAGTSVYLDRVGGTATLAGIGATVFSVAAAAARLIIGPLIDSKGRAFIMVVGAVVMIIGAVGPLFYNLDALFILWRFFQGAGFAMVTTASAAAAADVLPASRLGEGIGYYGLGQAISMSIGPAIALFLVAMDPAENFYYGLICAAVMALTFSLLIRYEKNPASLPATSAYRVRWEKARSERAAREAAGEPEPEPRKRRLLDPSSFFEKSALPGFVPMVILSPAFGFSIFFMGLYGASIGVGSAGIFYTVSALVMIAIRLKSKSFMNTTPAFFLFAVAVGCTILSYLILLACSAFDLGGAKDIVFYLAGIPYGVGIGVSVPACQTVAVRYAPTERYGAASALYLLAPDIGIGVCSIVWGLINDNLGFPVTLCCIIVLAVVSLVVAWLVFPIGEKKLRS